MNLSSIIRDPLRGNTPLGRVVWVYGLLGSILVGAIGLFIDSSHVLLTRAYALFGYAYSAYVCVATYQCARNSKSKSLAWFVRICAVISLVLLPLFAYWEFTGALDLDSLMMRLGP